MLKALRAKKLGSKYSNKSIRIHLLLLITFIKLAPLFSQEHHEEKHDAPKEEKNDSHTPKKSSTHEKEDKHEEKLDSHGTKSADPHSKENQEEHSEENHSAHATKTIVEPPEFQEKLKTANYDYHEKLFGQAIDNYEKILQTMGKNLTVDQTNDINLKMAHCHFELGQLYKAIFLLDPIIGLDKLPLDFQMENFESSLLSFDEFVSLIKESPQKGVKPITEFFPHLIANENITKEFLVEAFNKILNSSDSCKKFNTTYGNIKEWKNILISQFPKNKTKSEQVLLTRLILEELYPLNSYLSNKKVVEKKEADDHHGHSQQSDIKKDSLFFQALYWRSRIYLETSYLSFAKTGFEEILANLNFRENEKIIDALFYKAKSKFFLNQNKLALKELEDLNSLYGIEEYYKNNYYDETIFLIGRCFFELSKFDKAIQKFISITAGYDNREPRNKLIRNAYYWLGEAYYCKGQLNDAIKSYEVIISYGSYAEKEIAHYSLGWALCEKGDRGSFEAAKEQFNLLLTNYPNTEYRLKTELKQVELEIEEGNAEKAEKIISELKNSSENVEFLIKNNNLIKQTDFLFGLLYAKKKDYNKALVFLKKCEDTIDLKLKQKINIQTGLCYKSLGDFKKAIFYFNLASDVSANENIQVLAKSYLADTYFGRRTNQLDLETAAKAFDDLITLYPNHELNTEWRKKKANALRQQNQDDEAIVTLGKILEENQTEWEVAQLEIGNILMSTSPQRFTAATNHYKAVIDKIQNKERKDEALLNYGICLLKTNQGIDAIRVFQNLIQGSKNEQIITDAYQYLASCFEKEKNIKEAIKLLEESLKKYPQQKNQLFLHKECVRLYQLLSDIESAIKHLNIVYKETTDPNGQAEALFQLAGYDLKSETQSQAESGQQKLKLILQNHPKTLVAPKAAYLLGQILISKNKFEEALPYLEKNINDNNDIEMTVLSLIEIGNYYYQNNDFGKANEYYKKINFQDSSENLKKNESLKESVLMKKADSQFQLKEFPAAKDEYMNLIRMNRENSFYKIRYSQSCLESKQRIADAISLLEKIPKQDQTKETEQLLERLRDLQIKLRK